MGFLTPIDRSPGARDSRNRHRYSPGCLRGDEMGPVRLDSIAVDSWVDKPVENETRGRQLSALAQLVRAIEPEQADRLAQRLIFEFGSIGQVFAAAAWKITQITGNEGLAAIFSASRTAVLEGMREDVMRSPIALHDPNLMKYLIAQMQGEEEEHLHAIFLDSQQRYIRDERVASGDWSNLTLRMRPLFRRTMDLRAANLILCHNHPSGTAKPSKADIVFTTEVSHVARSLGTRLLDHLIVAGTSVFSMRAAGLIS